MSGVRRREMHWLVGASLVLSFVRVPSALTRLDQTSLKIWLGTLGSSTGRGILVHLLLASDTTLKATQEATSLLLCLVRVFCLHAFGGTFLCWCCLWRCGQRRKRRQDQSNRVWMLQCRMIAITPAFVVVVLVVKHGHLQH